MSPRGKTLLLLDTASLYFRAYYGIRTPMTAPDGTRVNAVRGLLDFIAGLVTRYSPTDLVAAWDDDWRPAWRTDLIASYKAHRVAYDHVEEVPDELERQVPIIRETLDALGIAVVGAPGCEADDVIGTYASADPGTGVFDSTDIVTGDRDLFQLVDDARAVRVLYTARGVSKLEVFDEAAVAAKYGIPGDLYLDFSVLRGDPSDGLPGVPGVGEKTAASLVSTYGGLGQIKAAAADDGSGMSPTIAGKIRAAADYLQDALQVVRVRPDADLPAVDTAVPTGPANPDRWRQLVEQWGLGGSADRVVAALDPGTRPQ